MITLYLLHWNHKCYASSNGMEMLRFADWLGAEGSITTTQDAGDRVPNVRKIYYHTIKLLL